MANFEHGKDYAGFDTNGIDFTDYPEILTWIQANMAETSPGSGWYVFINPDDEFELLDKFLEEDLTWETTVFTYLISTWAIS